MAQVQEGINRTFIGTNVWKRITNDIQKNKYIYIMAIPVVLFYLLFHYKPMYGAIIAFKQYSPSSGIMGSPWVGLKHFHEFMTSFYFWRLIKNTLLISVYDLVFNFPAPILLALLLNEIRNRYFKSMVQTVTYLPHFISLVVVCGMIKEFTASDGVINDIIGWFGGTGTSMLQQPEFFRSIYISTNMWQEIGWGSIIYFAALSSIDPELYEACTIDGAGRFKQILHVTLPSLMPTIVILLILRMGRMLNVGFEKIILLYNPSIYETADVISSYVYRKGLQEFDWSFSSAVGLFNAAINFVLLVLANKLSRKLNDTSLW